MVTSTTWPGPSNPRTDPQIWRAGPCKARVSCFSLRMSSAGPEKSRILWAEPGRAEKLNTMMSRAGSDRENLKFDAPGRTAAHLLIIR